MTRPHPNSWNTKIYLELFSLSNDRIPNKQKKEEEREKTHRKRRRKLNPIKTWKEEETSFIFFGTSRRLLASYYNDCFIGLPAWLLWLSNQAMSPRIWKRQPVCLPLLYVWPGSRRRQICCVLFLSFCLWHASFLLVVYVHAALKWGQIICCLVFLST